MKKTLSYDKAEDILYFNQGEKVQDSLDIGNLYIEFAGDNSVVGMEILQASETISQMTDIDFSPDDLKNILEAEIKVHRNGEYAFIVLAFTLEKGKERVKESIGVNVPSTAVTA